MRPRPEGRGELAQGVRDGEEKRPSMRPRPEGRGERSWPGTARRRRTPFNAATARRPWRTVARVPEAVEEAAPSMRPRPEGRGEL